MAACLERRAARGNPRKRTAPKTPVLGPRQRLAYRQKETGEPIRADHGTVISRNNAHSCMRMRMRRINTNDLRFKDSA